MIHDISLLLKWTLFSRVHLKQHTRNTTYSNQQQLIDIQQQKGTDALTKQIHAHMHHLYSSYSCCLTLNDAMSHRWSLIRDPCTRSKTSNNSEFWESREIRQFVHYHI